MTNWQDIHPDFTPELQKDWEDWGFNYWETKDWIEKGLKPRHDAYFAYCLKYDYTTDSKVLEKHSAYSVKPGQNAQQYLDENYPFTKRNKITKLDISGKKLLGNLTIENFPNLEKLTCISNQITKLTLSNLSKLTKVYCGINYILTDLVIVNCPMVSNLSAYSNSLGELKFLDNLNSEKLTYLNIADNNFPPHDLSVFSKFKNLRYFHLGHTSFYGSLKPLKELVNLETLDFAKTNVDSDLEYLSEKVEQIVLRKEEKKREIAKELEPYCKTSIDIWSYYDPQSWKKNQPYFKWLKEELEKLNPNLNVYDVLKNVFFNVRTGEFVGNHYAMSSLLNINKFLLDEKERKVNFLEARIQELTIQVKKQWKKVHKAYLYCVSKPEEKELLDQLIKEHIEFTRFKKQGFGSVDYRKRCREYKNDCQRIETELEELLEGRLEAEIAEETMNKVEHILTECEEIANWQLELEEKINNKKLALEEGKHFSQLPYKDHASGSLMMKKSKDQITLYDKKNKELREKLKSLQLVSANRKEKNYELKQKAKEIEHELRINLISQKMNQKKNERNHLITKINKELENKEVQLWLKELIKTQKKIITSSATNSLQTTILQNIKDKLTDCGIEQEEIEKICEIQKKISELKQQLKKGQEQTSQIQIPPK